MARQEVDERPIGALLVVSPARGRNRPRTRVGAVGALCVLAMPASALVSPERSLGGGFTVADAVLGAMLLLAVPQLLRGIGPMARLVRLLGPWIWVLFLGSTVSILFAGGPTWAGPSGVQHSAAPGVLHRGRRRHRPSGRPDVDAARPS